MADKMQDADFLGDTEGMLRFGATFDPQTAYELVREKLIDRMAPRLDRPMTERRAREDQHNFYPSRTSN